MKTIKNLKFLFLIAFALVTINFSCQKEADDSDTEIAQDNSLAEGVFSDLNVIVDQGYSDGNSTKAADSFSILSSCATITLDTIANPHLLTIDFGTTNCLCGDGRYRRGVVSVSFTGRYRAAGTVITISTNNYYVDDNKVTGTKTISNLGLNNNGNPNFSIQVSGSIEKVNNGGTITFNSTRNREWIAGNNTSILTDDIYLINGSGSGVSSANVAYTFSITNPLRKEVGCKNIVSGTFVLSIAGKVDRTFDYGNGSCDNIATVTILSKTYTITLK